MIEVLALLAEIGHWSDARKGAKIVDEMRLVEVTIGQCHIRPINWLARFEKTYNLLKPLHPTKQPGCQSYLSTKDLYEPPRTKSDPFGNIHN